MRSPDDGLHARISSCAPVGRLDHTTTQQGSESVTTVAATSPALDAEPVASTALRVALLGCGTVGSEVARLLIGQAHDLRARVGRPLELVGIAVRRAGRDRDGIDPELFTTDADALVTRSDVDLVVEVIGGIEPARSLILAALR